MASSTTPGMFSDRRGRGEDPVDLAPSGAWRGSSRASASVRTGFSTSVDAELSGPVAVQARGRYRVRIGWIVGEQDALQARHQVFEDLQALRVQVEVAVGHPGDVAAGPGKAPHEPQLDGVAHDGGEDDRDPVGGLLGRPRRVRVGGEKDVRPVPDQALGRLGKRGSCPLA